MKNGKMIQCLNYGPSDEIGKHARLKIACRKACGFNSHLGHSRNDNLNISGVEGSAGGGPRDFLY